MSTVACGDFPAADACERFIDAIHADSIPATEWTSATYLSLATVIVEEAFREWIAADGHFEDPYERSDRWQGGTLARLACPAAILINRDGRQDLLARTVQVVDCLMDRLSVEAGPLPPGVADLIMKEVAVALLELRPHVDQVQHQRWCGILGAICPERTYAGNAKESRGDRVTNYEVYASVGEWLRYQLGVADRRDWLEHFLGASLDWFTGNGMYRDPGDPILYDLSVRQNLTELLAYGYDGEHRESVDCLLQRAGICTLLMQSPLGWAPYGGRSNLFVHNEAMLAYICESEARRWAAKNDDSIAATFRGAARRAVHAIAPYVRMSPPHNLKNAFDPETKVGRDTDYGEYGVYSLLGASLLARTALLADDTIPAAEDWGPRGGHVLVLTPAFHRVFASVGDTQVEMDVSGQKGYDATGIGRIHRAWFPPPLGLSLSIPAEPRFITGEAATDRALAFGPVWRGASGDVKRLASWSGDVAADVDVEVTAEESDRVEWRVIHCLRDGAIDRVVQQFVLRPGVLSVSVEVQGDVEAVGYEIPCLCWDGRERGRTVLRDRGAVVVLGDARLEVTFPNGVDIEHEDVPRASREAWYTTVTGWSRERTLAVDVRVTHAPKSCNGEGSSVEG